LEADPKNNADTELKPEGPGGAGMVVCETILPEYANISNERDEIIIIT
jgi:hypothetical protein